MWNSTSITHYQHIYWKPD